MTNAGESFTSAFTGFLRYSEASVLYAEQLSSAAVSVQPTVHVAARQRIYREMRATLAAFVAFTDTVEQAMGPDGCRDVFPSIEMWVGTAMSPGEARVILATTCDCCGLPLAEDLLGHEMYCIGPFEQACAACFYLLAPRYPDTSRRLARLQAFASRHPNLLAAVVVAALVERGWDISNAEHALQLDELRFMQLILFERSLVADRENGPAMAANVLRCPVKPLQAFLADGVQASGSSRIAAGNAKAGAR